MLMNSVRCGRAQIVSLKTRTCPGQVDGLVIPYLNTIQSQFTSGLTVVNILRRVCGQSTTTTASNNTTSAIINTAFTTRRTPRDWKCRVSAQVYSMQIVVRLWFAFIYKTWTVFVIRITRLFPKWRNWLADKVTCREGSFSWRTLRWASIWVGVNFGLGS